ncbi:GerAB/ArcD/ProY family transporter [Bacillus sp. 165]|uniref:YkvI family membrane protein n=1 Tax=Bacillus sp. 165 TaxID=1529117 RepID=UPI001AD99C01|nr:GerAB/ArcD/ProY family transporter [Bacillus sp. 165]MBO9128168.1 GerAB/ArcD/ProY family transporter [Bacillus sp. 165]
MDDQNWKIAKKIAATYIGTVVGAGFATGREIVEFFTLNGTYGTIGILVSGILFMWLGTKMMILSARIQAFSAQEFNKYLFGNTVGTGINILLLLVLFGVTSVMLSAAGAVFEEQLHLPKQIGVLFTILACILILSRGLQGVFEVNSLVVPIMMLFIIGLFSTKIMQIGPLILNSIPAGTWNTNWVSSPITYVAMNLAMAQSVLVPLASEIKDEKAIKVGGLLGGAGLGLILLCSQFSLLSVDGFHQYNIPMAEVVRQLNSTFHFFFVLIIFGEVFTTLIGNLFGMSKQIQSMTGWKHNTIVLGILLISYCISYVGYGKLLHMLYPLIGWFSLILLPLIALKRSVK